MKSFSQFRESKAVLDSSKKNRLNSLVHALGYDYSSVVFQFSKGVKVVGPEIRVGVTQYEGATNATEVALVVSGKLIGYYKFEGDRDADKVTDAVWAEVEKASKGLEFDYCYSAGKKEIGEDLRKYIKFKPKHG